ncbi:MAG: fused MFS/spermidine synthase, partial [bacterium]
MDKNTPHRSFLDLSYWTILILFFLSGACGLIYEILWSRYLTLFLGSTTTAYTIVLAVFMGGLGLGNFLIGRLSDSQKNNLALFAWLQMLIGIYGVIFPLLWRFLSHTYISIVPTLEGSPFVLNLLKLIFSMASIFPPALLMGGTLPVLVRHLTRDIRQVRHNVSLLYYINSFGAVAGCLVVGLFLIRALGITASNYLAAGISIGIGMVALFLSYIQGRVSVVEEIPGTLSREASEGERGRHGVKVMIVLTAMALSGFTAMTYELAWTRLFSIILGSTTYSFPIMLAAFISGISLGSLIIARKKDLNTDPYLLFGLCELGIFLSILLSIPIYQWLPFAFLELNLLLGRSTGSFVIFQGLKFGFSFLVMLVPTIFFGMTLPLVSQVYAMEVEQVGQDVGTVFAFDTAGGVAGALTAGLLLIPGIGIRHTIELAFLINLAIGLVIISFPLNKKGFYRKAFIGVLSLLVVFYFAFLPEWDRHMLNAGAGRFTRREPLTFKDYMEDSRKGEVLFFREGRSATVSVERKLGVKTLLINSKPEASTMGDMPTQIMIGHLPLILAKDMQDVLVVGIGSGITIGSVLTHPVGHVDCVEISDAVFEASKYFSPENKDYWKDERIYVNIEDAKHFVKATDRRYDVIISEPSNPWVAGVADLFTVEFFNQCKRKMKPQGVMAQWFHGYSMDMENFRLIVRTFARCFDQVTMWEAMEDDYILIGVAEDYAPDF